MSQIRSKLIWLSLFLLLAGCEKSDLPEYTFDPGQLSFSGEKALETETLFVTAFPYRSSGMPNSRKAVAWLKKEFTRLGLNCTVDEWDIVNYSRPVHLRNVVAKLTGKSEREILIVAHHDQSPDTIQGADNDGSGIAILLQLAEIFAREETPEYTLVFVATDAEEYGMLGTKRYVDTHPRVEQIIAGISLDNLGKKYYDGMRMSAIGQFRRYGPVWLQRVAQEACRSAGDLWIPQIKSPVEQVLDQAVPVSFMDQGPMVAAGVPALGFAGHTPPEYRQQVWETYHSPRDSVTYQSAETLYQSGRIAEATLRALLSMKNFPERGNDPYIYFSGSGRILSGWSLTLVFLIIVAGFYLPAVRLFRKQGWQTDGMLNAVARFLSWWLPMVISVAALYFFVQAGLMDEYHLYPATSKDYEIYHPHWPAVILYVCLLATLFWVGNRLFIHFGRGREGSPDSDHYRMLAFFVLGLSATYLLVINPFSLALILPVFMWMWIREGNSMWVNILLFLLGGIMLYVLITFFGFMIMKNDWAILWYLMMMFSVGMVSFPTAMMVAAVISAGLLLVSQPKLKSVGRP